MSLNIKKFQDWIRVTHMRDLVSFCLCRAAGCYFGEEIDFIIGTHDWNTTSTSVTCNVVK